MRSDVRAILSTAFVPVVLSGVAGCSAKNPDVINAATVDENYAVGNGEANAADNLDAATANAAAPAATRPPANEAEDSSQANIDAAVNSLIAAEANENEVQEAEDEFNRDSDSDSN